MISPAFEFSSIFCTAEWLPVAQMPRVNSRLSGAWRTGVADSNREA
jgi:hypothetical protein